MWFSKEKRLMLPRGARNSSAYSRALSSILLNASGKIVLITSTRPGEGKSTVVIGLASCAVQQGQRVLLVDGDTRRPTLHGTLGTERSPGLTELLVNEDASHALPLWTNVPGIDPTIGQVAFIPSGAARDDAQFRLSEHRLRQILSDFSAGFDIVLIDSPPVLAAHDPVLIAKAADAVLLVVAAGWVDERDAQHAAELLSRTGRSIIGVVINRFDAKIHGSPLYRYESHYSVSDDD